MARRGLERSENGEVFPDLVTISTVKDTDGRVTDDEAFYSDITALKEHEAQLEQVAHFDSLTLPNRLMLADRLKQAHASHPAPQPAAGGGVH